MKFGKKVKTYGSDISFVEASDKVEHNESDRPKKNCRKLQDFSA